MMGFVRNPQGKISITDFDVHAIANKEKRIPLEWISPDHHDITNELYEYLYPLIQGEVTLDYQNGVPCYLDISHLM